MSPKFEMSVELRPSGPRFEYEDFVRLYDAFGVPEGEREQQGEGEKPEGDGEDGEGAPVAASGDQEKKFRLQVLI